MGVDVGEEEMCEVGVERNGGVGAVMGRENRGEVTWSTQGIL